jgi:hypothetical protein
MGKRSWSCAGVAALTALAAVGAAAAAPEEAKDHGPIPIYQPVVPVPVEAAGSGLTPLVRAKLTIDAAGRVRKVDVTAVEPSSALDGAFRSAAEKGLSEWRFAPAETGGIAVASDTAIAVQFFPAGRAPGRETSLNSSILRSMSESGYESARYDYRARILALTREARRQIADQIAAKAESLLNKDQRAEARSDWFEVVTDFGGQKQADALLQDCQSTFGDLFQLFRDTVPPRPREDRLRVYVFASKAQYQEFVKEIVPFEWSEGVYSPTGVLAFHVQVPTTSYLVATILHEVTHAFLDRHVVRQGVALPRWLDEGFAEYVGTSDIANGTITLGGHSHRKDVLPRGWGYVFWESPSRTRAESAQRAQRQNRALTLRQILAAGRETFYGKDVDLYYAQGWLAVHFLRHGRPGWADEQFPRFMLYVAEGYAADAAFRTVYKSDPDALEAEYQRYVKAF